MRVLQAPSQWPPWAVMWLLASCIYATCKWLTWHCADAHRVPPWKHAAYLLAWPGMDAGASAGGGYGGPTAFFALQSGAMLFERSAPGQRLGLGHGWRGWSFTMLALAVPVYWLFHPPFVEAVIVPFMRAVSAI